MENEEELDGIFLFKNSKTKASNETIFQEILTPTTVTSVLSEDAVEAGVKWMKSFLKKFLTPSLLHKPVTPVHSDQIIAESTTLPPFTHENDSLMCLPVKCKVRKITRGNRRHKIKTRKQRNRKTRK